MIASQLELTEKVVSIKRVTKVVKGGRNMRFAALVVVGDGNGHVGAGLGKATEIPEAIRKGKEDAIKKLIEVPLDENLSITHDNLGKFGGASVLLKRAPQVLVSSQVVLHVTCWNCRLQEHPYKISWFQQQTETVVLATIEGLSNLVTPEEVAKKRGKSIEEILG